MSHSLFPKAIRDHPLPLPGVRRMPAFADWWHRGISFESCCDRIVRFSLATLLRFLSDGRNSHHRFWRKEPFLFLSCSPVGSLYSNTLIFCHSLEYLVTGISGSADFCPLCSSDITIDEIATLGVYQQGLLCIQRRIACFASSDFRCQWSGQRVHGVLVAG